MILNAKYSQKTKKTVDNIFLYFENFSTFVDLFFCEQDHLNTWPAT